MQVKCKSAFRKNVDVSTISRCKIVGSIPITRSKTPFLKAATKNAEKPCVSRAFGVF
nr:MAG TPA: hypothetical protein [Caudoviricetes sp.]